MQKVEKALERERKEHREVLFPVRLDRAVMESEDGWPGLIRNTRNIGDFTRWKQHDRYQKAFERLLHDLKSETPLTTEAESISLCSFAMLQGRPVRLVPLRQRVAIILGLVVVFCHKRRLGGAA